MPKLIDYPRTSYTGAWELAEITDDTGGKCTIETAARKLNRKVSGSFKAIIGSAVKFGLITSKRELLTTTTLFKRIKHAYDKQEELTFHREAFLTPPLFTQICRKFRSRELPVQMLDVMLIREFGVEEINAQGVAKAFVDGCRMVGLLDENNTVADIDAFTTRQPARQHLASPTPKMNAFHPEDTTVLGEQTKSQISTVISHESETDGIATTNKANPQRNNENVQKVAEATKTVSRDTDAIATLFGFTNNKTSLPRPSEKENEPVIIPTGNEYLRNAYDTITQPAAQKPAVPTLTPITANADTIYQVRINGPGVNTELIILEEEDIAIAFALLEKIRRQLKSQD